MTDAELIGLAALVNASCTEITAANEGRAARGHAQAYDSYADIYGDRSTKQIEDELERRDKIRKLLEEYRSTLENCLASHPSHALLCHRAKDHTEETHAAVDQSDEETFLTEWPRSADEPKPVAPGEDIPF